MSLFRVFGSNFVVVDVPRLGVLRYGAGVAVWWSFDVAGREGRRLIGASCLDGLGDVNARGYGLEAGAVQVRGVAGGRPGWCWRKICRLRIYFSSARPAVAGMCYT